MTNHIKTHLEKHIRPQSAVASQYGTPSQPWESRGILSNPDNEKAWARLFRGCIQVQPPLKMEMVLSGFLVRAEFLESSFLSCSHSLYSVGLIMLFVNLSPQMVPCRWESPHLLTESSIDGTLL